MSRKTALILLNGDVRDAKAVRAASRRAGYLLCADGGARHAVALRLTPNWIIGDMDSLPKKRPPSWKKTRYWCDFDPERSDLDKALEFARSLDVGAATVAGALGGGLDHELINLAALEESARGLELTVIDGGSARLFGPGRRRLPFKRGDRFSLLAAPRARLTLTGARFGLKNELLRRGSRGLGNCARGPVTLSIREGRVWVISTGPLSRQMSRP
ncbi:MAG: thiamine diphosphokinase [Elusimicrobia bacterium]|nr:thiamine diphosphokinase [Elusimicrobiota bacterium]